MGFYAIAFAIDVLVTTLCIWLATKFSFVKMNAKDIAVVVLLVAAVSVIPTVVWILGLVLFVYLLTQLASCTITDAIWVVLFTKLFSFGAILAFSYL